MKINFFHGNDWFREQQHTVGRRKLINFFFFLQILNFEVVTVIDTREREKKTVPFKFFVLTFQQHQQENN